MNGIAERMLSLLEQKYQFKGDAFDLIRELDLVDPVTDRRMTAEEKEYVKSQMLALHPSLVLREQPTPAAVVVDPGTDREWYDQWLEQNSDPANSYHWRRLEDFLLRTLSGKYNPENAHKIVRSIDSATHAIMRSIANPQRKEFDCKGLVVGYVQSGKTANFTALIAKATDAGYRLIVVLAGIHNALRRQTQIRLDRELTGIKEVDSDEPYIDMPGNLHDWWRLTSCDQDFKTNTPFRNVSDKGVPILAVVKKRVSVLNKLIDYLAQASAEQRASIPLLVIDDEADQASIDTNANDPDADPQKTNAAIRRLLMLFPRKTYIGYTATPFANVLIDMNSTLDTHGDDLYPRDFIVSLPEPEGYFGTSQIFDSALSEQFACIIPDETVDLVDNATMTERLAEAIDTFLLACAVRNLRGDKEKPMSMLVHVKHTKTSMTTIEELVGTYIEDISGRYKKKAHRSLLKDEFEEVWNDFRNNADAICRQLRLDYLLPDYDAVWEELGAVLEVLRIVKLNSESEDRLDYTVREEIKVIAIGGNQLSRGLTLEGLMISYFLRRSQQYDTLLQMARWFGYRHGYEDLTRVFTDGIIWESFAHLAMVEKELRSEIYRYEEEDMTPMDMALAIRDHERLLITAPNKMGAGRNQKISFSGSTSQTIWMPLDKPDVLKANYDLGEAFIREVTSGGSFQQMSGTGVWLADHKVLGSQVIQFLRQYQFVEKDKAYGPGLDSEGMLDYISRRLNDSYGPELTQWSVAVAGNKTPVYSPTPVNYGGLQINRTGRSRKVTPKGFNIGVLTESEHLRIDLPGRTGDPNDDRSEQNPLLLLYLIAKESRPQGNSTGREPLFEGISAEDQLDVLGIAIVFPNSKREPDNYFGQ